MCSLNRQTSLPPFWLFPDPDQALAVTDWRACVTVYWTEPANLLLTWACLNQQLMCDARYNPSNPTPASLNCLAGREQNQYRLPEDFISLHVLTFYKKTAAKPITSLCGQAEDYKAALVYYWAGICELTGWCVQWQWPTSIKLPKFFTLTLTTAAALHVSCDIIQLFWLGKLFFWGGLMTLPWTIVKTPPGGQCVIILRRTNWPVLFRPQIQWLDYYYSSRALLLILVV